MRQGFLINDYTRGITLDDSLGSPKHYIWGALIGAGVGLASTIIGGAASAKQARKAEDEANAQKARNDAWYQRRYNESYADTAAGQNIIRKAQDYADRQTKRIEGSAAMGGATDASVAMAKENANKMFSDTMADIAAQDTARKDNADNIKMQNDQAYSNQQQALYQQRAQNVSNVATGLGNAAMMAGSAYDGYKDAKANAVKTTGATA